MRLADARRAEEDHVLLTLQEAELVERVDLLALDRGLEAEVEVVERLHGQATSGPTTGALTHGKPAGASPSILSTLASVGAEQPGPSP